MGSNNNQKMKVVLIRGIAILFFIFLIFLSYQWLEWQEIKKVIQQFLMKPQWILILVVAYFSAFLLRAYAWKWYVDKTISTKIYLQALFWSLFLNHLFPIKIGDLARTGYLMKEKNIEWDEAVHSVIAMRTLDLLSLGLIAGIGSILLGIYISWLWYLILFCGVILSITFILFLIKKKSFSFLQKHKILLYGVLFKKKGLIILFFIFMSWMLEAIVVYGVCVVLAISINMIEALWVNSITIAGQVFHFTPGGIGTYESVMSFSLTSLGVSWKQAFYVAVVSHSFKFIFSFAVGIYVILTTSIPLSELMTWIKRKEVQKI
jgi:uncharacterized membrane protein YbhN (UPF0104 family)